MSIEIIVQNFSEIPEQKLPKHGDVWGGAWRFNADSLTLESICSGYAYYVDLEKISDRGKLLAMVDHLLQKTWCQGENVGHFIAAVHDLCPCNWYEEFSVGDIVRERFKK
jgi:hypothetical protein